MRKLLISLLLALVPAISYAQTVGPVVTTLPGSSASGSVTITNNQLFPLIVTVEPQSFNIDEQGIERFRSLDNSVSVQLSDTSFRLSAKASRSVFYKARCVLYQSCHFVIYATFGQPGQSTGLRILLHLPSVVYLAGKRQPRKEDIRAEILSNGMLKITNLSTDFVRADDMEIGIDGKKYRLAGFPLFPESDRLFPFRHKPDYVLIKFPKFKIDTRKGD